MVALALVLVILLFVSGDVVVRTALARREKRRKMKEREEALQVALKLSFADETKSLKRVTVDEPKARILAVDDEEVVLDSLRRVLVVDGGFSLDTVTSGPEALSLIRNTEYDFVFTDLRMPEMDGIDVVKSVKHLRPSTDIVVVTGFASVESAIETMKYGATDYLQKPFTPEELLSKVHKLVLQREERLAVAKRPEVHLVTPSTQVVDGEMQLNVLSGVFVGARHVWVGIEPNGTVTLGLDDFAQKLLGKVDKVTLPAQGETIKRGDRLFVLHNGKDSIEIGSPVSGAILSVNHTLSKSPQLVNLMPYEAGWICRIEPSNLPAELGALKIGAGAVSWYQEEVDRYLSIRTESSEPFGQWRAFTSAGR